MSSSLPDETNYNKVSYKRFFHNFFHLLLWYFTSFNEVEAKKKRFFKTIKLNEEYLAAYYQLGQTSEKLGKKKEAKEIYLKGLELAKKQKNQKAVNEINEAIMMLDDN